MSFTIATPEGITAIEQHLATNAYLSGGNAPTGVDSDLLTAITEAAFRPNQTETPNFFGWWWTLSPFQPLARQQWSAPAKAAKKGGKAQKKAAAAEEDEDDDDLDLFGDDPEADAEAAKQAEARKNAAAATKKKPKKTAKSIIVFNVKGYEVGFDWDSYSDTIRAIEFEGVTWMDQHKVVDIAFGMKML